MVDINKETVIACVVTSAVPDKIYDYLVPSEFKSLISPGQVVLVPLGKRIVKGYVVSIKENSEYPNLKSIINIEMDSVLTPPLITLARWIADYYCAPFGKVLDCMIPSPVRKIKGKFIYLVEKAEIISQIYATLTLPQKRLMDILTENSRVELQELLKKAVVSRSVVFSLEKKGLVRCFKIKKEEVSEITEYKFDVIPATPPVLTDEQEIAVNKIYEKMESLFVKGYTEKNKNVILIHGVTGSGKTEIYLRAITKCIEYGRSAIVLVPEVSLTPQTVDRFLSRFGNSISVMHSYLGSEDRRREWERILRGMVKVVIGARSAVFAPLKNIGLIVVDEEHENTYKQEDMPHYHARDVAIMRGVIENALVILGSATPSLESWMNVLNKKYELCKLSNRVDGKKLPVVRAVDMRQQYIYRKTKTGYLSDELINAIAVRLERHEQVILFLNRRGFASGVICPRCGYVASCSKCSVSYTYHKDCGKLLCHFCGREENLCTFCPKCNNKEIRMSGVGTERVENAVSKIFPKARIARLDADSVRKIGRHEEILRAFKRGEIDILVGTQMIAKGLDFPNVTLVGVIYADISLHLPDFRAAERTFQLLAQVAGRAGRGEVSGEVIIQTYTPFHPVIQSAIKLDYEGFYSRELLYREELFYPPFSKITALNLRSVDLHEVRKVSLEIVSRLSEELSNENVRISKPVVCPVARMRGEYRYRILLRHKTPLGIKIRQFLSKIKIPKKVSLIVDVDPYNLI